MDGHNVLPKLTSAATLEYYKNPNFEAKRKI
jgi:hypothetical protein